MRSEQRKRLREVERNVRGEIGTALVVKFIV